MNSKIPPPYRPAPSPAASTDKPSPASQTSPAPAGKTSTGETVESKPAPAMTGEGLMQRLRYFENLASQYEHYIGQLKAVITRQGAAVPVGYFAPLKGEGGSYTPNA